MPNLSDPMTAHRCATLALAAAALLHLASAATAQTGGATSAPAADRQARVWAAACATCHTAGAIPPIAGRDAETLTRALLEFKTGQRAATVMHQHAKGYTDDELRRIAQVVSTQTLAAQPAR